MAKKMSANSRSYSRVNDEFEASSERFEKEVSYLPVRTFKEENLSQLKYLQEHTKALQSVFRAEFIKTCTKAQIINHLENLKIVLEETNPDKIFKISCHPQSDATTKSAHFHVWGDVTPEMEKVFEQYLVNNKLTIQEKVNITAIAKGEIREVIFNEETNSEEIRAISVQKGTSHFKVTDKSKANDYNDSTNLFEESRNVKVSSFNETKSVVIETFETKVENDEDIYIKKIDKLLEEKLAKADETFLEILKSREFEEFESKFSKTFENLNSNLDEFLKESKTKTQNLEERIKKSLELGDL